MAKVVITVPNGGGGSVQIPHNELDGLQGTGPDYFHLNQEQYDNIINPQTPNLQEVLESGSTGLNIQTPVAVTTDQFISLVANDSNGASQISITPPNSGVNAITTFVTSSPGISSSINQTDANIELLVDSASGNLSLNLDNDSIVIKDEVNNKGITTIEDYSDQQILDDNAYASTLAVKKLINNLSPETSIYKESFQYSGGSQNFNLAFTPTNVLLVVVQSTPLNGTLPAPLQYTVSGNVLTINDTLSVGEYIQIVYTNSITDSSSYSKTETDALISAIPIAESSEIVLELFNKNGVESDFIPIFSDGVGPESGSNYGMGFPIGAYRNLKKVKVRIYINIAQSPLATSILAKIKRVDKNGTILATSTVTLPSTPTTGSYPIEFDFGLIENNNNDRLYLELFSEGKFGSYRRFPNSPSIFTNANGYPPYALNNVNTAFATGVLNNTTAYYDFYHEATTVTEVISLTDSGKELLSSGSSFNGFLPTNNKRYSFSGSSVTWGDGYLQSHYVGSLINKMQTKIATSILPSEITATGSTDLINRMYFNGNAKKITGIGSQIEFNISGDEVSIVQAIERSNTSASEIEVYIDDVLYDTFNNYNPEPIGSETKNFTGNGTALQFDLGKAFTYNHSVTVNGVSQSVVMNLNQSTGFVIPGGTNCAIIRKLGIRADGSTNVTHWLWFASAPANGATIAITYNYGENLFYEKTTIGQDLAGTNESPYGDGNTEYDTQNPAATSSGLDFRQTDERVLKTYRFTENKSRNVRLKIKGNYNGSSGTPYFIFNFATNRFFHFQNAGIGGWDLWDFDEQIPTEPTRGWQKVVEFNPDYFLYETTPNDDVRVKGHRIYTPKNITLSELRSIRTFPLREVAYQSGNDTYNFSRWNGIITAITPTSVTFSGTVDTPIVAGDLIMIGNYYANNNEFIQRFVASVSGNTISFNKPISPDENIFINLQSFVGQEIRVRDYSIFVDKLETVLNKIKESQPNMIIGVLPNPLPNIQTRELWGYPMVLQRMAKENNFSPIDCSYFQIWQDSQQKTSVTIAASSLLTDTYTGWKVAEFGSTGANTISLDVLINGISVYPNDAVVENGWSFGVSKTATGATLNKLTSEFTSSKQERNQKPRLIFKQNAPVSGNITVKYAANLWSPDSTHLTNSFGVELYAELLFNEFIIK